MEWNSLRLFTTEKIAFCASGCPFSTASRRRNSRISPGMSILPGHTCVQLPHWMQRLWISSDDLQRVEPGGEDGADAAGINLAEDVAADQPEHRAHVQARGAADALQRLLELRVLRHLGAAVVHQDDVQLLRRAVGIRHRAADDRDVAGEQLRRGAAGQGGQHRARRRRTRPSASRCRRWRRESWAAS